MSALMQSITWISVDMRVEGEIVWDYMNGFGACLDLVAEIFLLREFWVGWNRKEVAFCKMDCWAEASKKETTGRPEVKMDKGRSEHCEDKAEKFRQRTLVVMTVKNGRFEFYFWAEAGLGA